MFRKISALLLLSLSLSGWVIPAHAATILGNPVPVLQSAAAEHNHVFKATGGNLYSVTVTPASTAGFLLIYDATVAPSDGSVTPNACYSVAASISTTVTFVWPFPFVNGIVAVFSTTGCTTQTSSNAFFDAQVK